MPVDEYYKGSGEEVMSEMQKRYGKEEGKRVFYATANKRKMNPEDDKAEKEASAFQEGYLDGYRRSR